MHQASPLLRSGVRALGLNASDFSAGNGIDVAQQRSGSNRLAWIGLPASLACPPETHPSPAARPYNMPDYRIERDTMGEMRVPADALYGAQTQRAVENFPISGLRFPRSFLSALGLIKSCAARVNSELGE